jgi:hypothetical protein
MQGDSEGLRQRGVAKVETLTHPIELCLVALDVLGKSTEGRPGWNDDM